MIITITGDAGSGKSTLAEKLADELAMPRIYVGGIRRDMAKEMGMTLAEFNTWSETNSEGDVAVDERVVKECTRQKNCIAEGRVMYHFFPNSLKIYLAVDLDTAAQRIFQDLADDSRNEDSALLSVEDVKKSIEQRKASDDLRYQKYYGINAFDHDNFDLIIDTTHKSKEAVFEEALDFIEIHS
jgi:cytidylate kinase